MGKESPLTKKQFMIEHIKLMRESMGERKASLEFRKFTPYYFKGMTGIKDLKIALQISESVEQIISLISENF